MNKSKFLKKSLAALLAILMVAAMIPLSAAAAQITATVTDEDGNEKTVTDTINVNQGTLESEDDTWTVTLPYSANVDTVLSFDTTRTDVEFYGAVGDADLSRLSGGKLTVAKANMAQGASDTAKVEFRDVEGTVVATYNFTVNKEVASNDTTVTEAAYTYTVNGQSKTAKATPDGNTITFKGLPWGHVTSSLALNQISLTMTAPNSTESTRVFNSANSNQLIATDGKVPVTVTAQNGDKAQYNLVFEEAECLIGLTIDGEEAVLDTTDPSGKTYKAVIDAVDTATPVVVTTPLASNKWQYDFYASNGSFSSYNNQKTLNTSSQLTYKLQIGDKASPTENKKTYNVNIEVRKNSDTKVKSLKVTAGGFTETGVVADNGTMSAVLANGTSFTSLTGTVNLTMNGKVSYAMLNNATTGAGYVDQHGSPAATVTFPSVALKAQNDVKIVAEDGTTAIYSLNLSADPKTQDKPAVKGVTMTYGTGASAKKYEGKISGKEITFTLPKADENSVKSNINTDIMALVANTSATLTNISFDWDLTPHTAVSDYADIGEKGDVSKIAKTDTDKQLGKLFDVTNTTTPANGKVTGVAADISTIDYFKGYYELTDAGTADDGNGGAGTAKFSATTKQFLVGLTLNAATPATDWTVKFEFAPAEKEARLNGITFYNTAKKADINDDNTYKGTVTQSNKTVTVAKEIPHAVGTFANPNITIEYDISKGAKLFYVNAADSKIYAITGNGWNATTGKAIAQVKASALLPNGSTKAKLVVFTEEGYITSKTALDAVIGGTAANYVGTSSGDVLYNLTKGTHYEEYTLDIKKTDESQACDLISVKSPDGAVVGFVNAAGSVELVVPETYVVEGKETEFDLVFETSPLTKSTTLYAGQTAKSATNDKGVIEGLKVVANDNGTYSLKDGSDTITSMVVEAEKTGIIKNYTVSVSAKTLSDDVTLNSISVNGVEAKQAGGYGMWSIVLPSGTDLSEITKDDFTVDIVESATYSIAPGEEENTYIITVTAEDQKTTFDHTVALVVNDKPENPFTDIGDPEDPNNWYASSVVTAVGKGWVTGMGDGKFDPTGSMRRGDFALIIARILAGGETEWNAIKADYAKDVFTDVKEGLWYYEAVAYVVDEGIMDGRGAGIFDPMGTITRQEAAKVMAIASGLEEVPGNTVYADDASIAGWAKPFVNACTKEGIFQGAGDSFNPTQKLTRAMGATILVRAFDKAEEPEVPAE